MSATTLVYTVLYDDPSRNDGLSDSQKHFKSPADAGLFASQHRHYGKPCQIQTNHVPRHIARRWAIH